jgi:predicted acylesterase/phospholipase RssA
LETPHTLDLHHLHILSRLFEELDSDALRKILEAGKKHQIEPGEYLFRQGDLESILYIVLSGRLRAVMQDTNGTHILGDIGEGEPAGEFAIFTNEPRMASVLAIRKTTVLEINKKQYLNLVTQNPALAGTLTSFLIKRLRRNVLEQHMSGAPKNIALINLQPEHDLRPWTDEMEKTLGQSGISTQVFDHDSHPEKNYHTVFNSLEQHDGLNVLVCSQACPQWSKLSLIYADLVIVATHFSADSNLYEIEKMLDLYVQSILNKKIYLVFLHDHEGLQPQNTNNWLDKRKVNLHIHVRKHHTPDIRRFCRIISHQAVGLVLGGGGAKGFAHVGAVRALLNAGVEIDFLGGTSAGALYGIGMSYCDFDFQKINALCQYSAKKRLTSNDYSWPLLSIMSGKKMNAFLKKMFGSSHLEDIWINSYCVSTNFSSSATKVHDKGLTSRMVQASIAIPGVFPPVVIDRQLHVDGGVVDNLPIDPMYRYPVRHIIAISLSSFTTIEVDYTDVPSVGKLIWDKLTGKKRYRIPGITSLIINSLTLNSRQKQEIAKSKVSMYVELDLKGVGLMDDKKWIQTIEKGHKQTISFLENLPDKEKFWLT